MKRVYLLFITIFAVQFLHAQWTTSGSNIYYNAGKVSVGTTTAPTNGAFQVLGPFDIISVNNIGVFRVYDGSNFAGGVGTDAWAFNGNNTDFTVYTPNNLFLGSGGQKRMSILGSGNVGIGTTNPGSRLHVVGVSATPPNMAYMSTGNIPFKVQTRPDANDGLAVFDSNSNTSIQSGDIVNGTGVTSLNLQPFGGNVGIGTLSPSSLLTLLGGNVAVQNNLSIGGIDGNGILLYGNTGNLPYRAASIVPFIPFGATG